MSVKKYKYNDKTQLSSLLKLTVQDFRCKGKTNNVRHIHDVLVDTELIKLLEKLYTQLGATSVKVISGHRCKDHDIKVGGSGHGSHTKGEAVDIIFYNNKNVIYSSTICLTLEDMGHKYGIGYRCGKKDENGETHIDVKKRKWYGDEFYKPYKTVVSFYTYLGVERYKVGKYLSLEEKYVRTKPSMNGKIKKVKDFNNNKIIQKALTSTKPNDLAKVAKNHKFTASAFTTEKNGRVWMKNLNNGYMCIRNVDGTENFKKVG